MRKIVLLFALFTMTAFAASASAEEVPECRLGRAPVNKYRMPAPGEQYFIAPKGAIVHMEFRTPGQQRLTDVRCKLADDVESWAMSPSRAWDVPSGNDFTPEGWVIPYKGLEGPQGPRGEKGEKGDPGPPGDDCDIYKTKGFFLHHTFKQCGNEEAQVIDRGLRGWVIPTAFFIGAATGGLAAAPLCVTLESAVAVGALTGAATAAAANVVVQDLPESSRTLRDLVNQ